MEYAPLPGRDRSASWNGYDLQWVNHHPRALFQVYREGSGLLDKPMSTDGSHRRSYQRLPIHLWSRVLNVVLVPSPR